MNTFSQLISDVLVPESFSGLKSPYNDFCQLGGLESHSIVVQAMARYGEETKDFANNNFLSGLFRNFLINVLKTGPSHPMYHCTKTVLPHVHNLSKAYSTINDRISKGEYVLEPVIRKQKPEVQKKIVTNIVQATGVAKEALSSLTPKMAVCTDMVDLCGGYGNGLKGVVNLGLGKYLNSYTNVDLNVNKLNVMTKRNYYDRANIKGKKLSSVNVDVNDYLSGLAIHPKMIFVSFNSVHFLSHKSINKIILSKQPFDGIFMASDFLFDFVGQNEVIAKDFHLKFDPLDLRVKGVVSGLIINERVMTSTDFPNVYPLLFCNQQFVGKRFDLAHPFWESFAFFSNYNFQNTGPEIISGSLGKPIRLVDAGYKTTFKKMRPQMHPLTQVYYDWLRISGCYVSPKLNGLAAFAYADQAGLWRICLRGNQTFVVRTDDDDMSPFYFSSDSTKQFYIELVVLNGKLYPFFLKDLTRGRNTFANTIDYWRYVFMPIAQKLTMVRSDAPLMSYKSYFKVTDDDNQKITVLIERMRDIDSKIPVDGLIFNDIFFNVSFYFKQLNTYDVRLDKDDLNVIFSVDNPNVLIKDPQSKYVFPSIYECCFGNKGDLIIGCLRPDKLKVSDMTIVPTIDFGFSIPVPNYQGTLPVELYTRMVINANFTVKIPLIDKKCFKLGLVVRPYEKVMELVSSAMIDPTTLDKILKRFKSRFKIFPSLVSDEQGHHYSCEIYQRFCDDIYPGTSYIFLWSQLWKANLFTRPPSNAHVRRNLDRRFVPVVTLALDIS